MSEENLPLISDLPVYQEDLDRLKEKKRKAYQNILYRQLNRLMDHFKVEAADIRKVTGIAGSTFSGWVNNGVETQMLDEDICKLANYFKVSINFLAFAVPLTDRDRELDDLMPDFDNEYKGLTA